MVSSSSQVCKGINITNKFTSFNTKITFKINHSFDCNNKCLIYLFSCKSCSKKYLCNITDHFRSRWNNWRSDVRKAESGNMEIVKHKSFCKVIYYSVMTKVFFKKWRTLVDWYHKLLIPPKRTFTVWEHLSPILKVTVNSLFRLIHTFM